MIYYRLDDDEKRIIRSAIRLDDKRRRGKIKRHKTRFDKKAREAIKKAERDIELGGATEEVRAVLIRKIRENIINGTTWERLGETYCGRDTFYRYSRNYQHLIARYMGIISYSSNIQGDDGDNG